MHKQINGVKGISLLYSKIPINKHRKNDRNLPFGKHFSTKFHRQESSINTKITG